jgi:transcriptional regulator GlxA family with amidase domain
MSLKKPSVFAVYEIVFKIEQAKSFIQENYHRDILLNDIAASAHLSIPHFNRKFKEHNNTTPYKYLMTVRLERATELLKTTNLSINEIVIQIGFYSTSSFIRLFKSYYGKTPANSRKNSKEPVL